MNLICLLKGHQWKNKLGGTCIVTSTGESVCYRCGHRKARGDDPASWFDYPGGNTDSWGTINPDKVPEGASLRSGKSGT